MASLGTQTKITSDDEEYLFAMQLAVASVMPMTMQAVMQLNVFEIIASAGEGAQLTPKEIASHLDTQNPEAPAMLDRMLRLLANHSVLTCSIVATENDRVERRYGLAPVCNYFIDNEQGVSFRPFMFLSQDFTNVQCWYSMKDAVLGGGIPFEKVHGMNLFEYNKKDRRHDDLFNRAMFVHTTMIMNKILEVYKGFENVKELVDVAGGIGTMSNLISSKYPAIKCTNFDLPHVIESAPSFPGVQHVGGNMFESVPKGETIFMKNIIHDWDDEDCLRILKNCFEALPAGGKVIAVDIVLSTGIGSGNEAKGTAEVDVFMMLQCPGGKERTEKEFDALAKKAGFETTKLVCCVSNYSVMEFYKANSN